MVITSLSRSEGPRFEPGWNHFYVPSVMLYLFYHTYLKLYDLLKKQRREVSINRPASYEPAALPLRHPAFRCLSLFLLYVLMTYVSFLKKLHHRESNPGHKRERLVCYQLHHNGLHYLLLVVDLFPFFLFLLLLLLLN